MGITGPSEAYDAIVVGAGPNGLVAGVVLARAGWSVLVVEAEAEPGGGCRSADLTLPGCVHDICAAVHPMGVISPALREIGLEQQGVRWAAAELPLAHPLPNGAVAVLRRSVAEMTAGLGDDGEAWRRLMAPLAREDFVQSLLHPVWDVRAVFLGTKLRFGLQALRSCAGLARSRFQGEAARALFAGCCAHSCADLDRAGTASFGLVLALVGHLADWPCAVGGSQEITRALVRALETHGGVLRTGWRVRSLDELPSSRAVLFDLAPRQVADLCGSALPAGYTRRLRRYRHGPGTFKIDWALDGPIPWRNEECRRAMTVHVGGSFEEVLRAEHDVAAGRVPAQPFVLVAQQSLFDPRRAPAGVQTGWAYCHVPNGCDVDMTIPVESAIERFAPGFRQRIRERWTMNAPGLEAHNAAMIGGDIGGGANDLGNFLFRPVPRWNPYSTPNPRLFLCSSATPPGGGVHGMCGYHAAHAVLKKASRR